MLPRSPGGLLTNFGPQTNPSSPLSPPLSAVDPHRRSTGEASDALRYYWSADAGAFNSSQSSLGISPTLSTSTSGKLGSSPYSIAAVPPRVTGSRSHMDLRGAAAPGVPERRSSAPLSPPLDRPRMAHSDSSISDVSDPGPSNRRIHVVSYPSSGSLGESAIAHSPSGLSDSSQYSDGKDEERVTSTGGEGWRPILPTDNRASYASAATATTVDANDDSVHRTPTQAAHARSDTMPGEVRAALFDSPAPGRLAFVAPPDVSRRSLDALEREVAGRRNMNVHVPTVDQAPQSAPAHQTEFAINVGGRDDVTLQARNENMLSPHKYNSGMSTPTRELRSKSPGRSPEPPPRSELRKQTPRADNVSQLSSPSPAAQAPPQAPPPPSKAEVLTQPPAQDSIQDLTDMLGGAIDAIGLIDSRDTPPPMLAEPSKAEPSAVRPSLVLRRSEDVIFQPTPVAYPPRQGSLVNSMPPPVSGGPQSAKPTQVMRRASSILSFRSTNQISPTFHNLSAKPWPSAMLFGHIKTMKTSGDRARGYARAINDLHHAESGLREWCQVSAAHANRSVLASNRSKLSSMSSLGARPPSIAIDYRKVSSSSEFPTRVDASAAREISTRMMDPDDQPTALPPNLPYPQLQPAGGGIKPSPSMQSVASVSGRRGFFSAIGRTMGSSKKDAGSTLGPPQSGFLPKKDVRGLPISGPAYDAHDGRASAPLGPRGPRGSFTPPPHAVEREPAAGRASLDMSVRSDGSMLRGARASLDQPRALRQSSLGPSREDDVRAMADVLPHADSRVLRSYLDAHGDRLSAISAYIDDEKMGTERS